MRKPCCFPVCMKVLTMQKFFVILVFYTLLKPTANRKCSGLKGIECCTGYALNVETGNCERCPIGYFGDDCSKQCVPPTYGEDCQSLCSCTDGFYCHFALGCSLHQENETDLQQTTKRSTSLVSTRLQTEPSRYSTSTATILGSSDSQQVSTNVIKMSKTTVNSPDTDIDVFKNNKVFLSIVVLIGIFVACFAIFVFTYIYFKCFRKTVNSSRNKENEWQAHYKSLDFEAMISEQSGHQAIEPRGRFISDSSYLSPVFVRGDSRSEPDGEHEIETSHAINEEPKPELNRQSTTDKKNEVTPPPGDMTEHVYIEITEGGHEFRTANVTADDGYENKEDITIRNQDDQHRESAYVNESKQLDL